MNAMSAIDAEGISGVFLMLLKFSSIFKRYLNKRETEDQTNATKARPDKM